MPMALNLTGIELCWSTTLQRVAFLLNDCKALINAIFGKVGLDPTAVDWGSTIPKLRKLVVMAAMHSVPSRRLNMVSRECNDFLGEI